MNNQAFSPSDRQAPIVSDIHDPNELSTLAKDGIHFQCVQLEARAFTAQWMAIPLSRLYVQIVSHSVSTACRVRVPADRALVVIPLRPASPARWNSRELSAQEFLVCAPGSEAYAFEPPGAVTALLSGAPELIDRASASGDTATEPLRFLRAQIDDLRRLQQALVDVRRDASLGGGAVRPVTEAALAAALVACLRCGRPTPAPVWSIAAPHEIVHRAESSFRRHLADHGEPPSITFLAGRVGISERALRNAFHDAYDIGPKRYFRFWRLHRARAALRAPEHSTVTSVAMLNGFYELGRFAVQYRELFGEVPSRTLVRAS